MSLPYSIRYWKELGKAVAAPHFELPADVDTQINVQRLHLETDPQVTDKAKDFSINGHLINEIKALFPSFQEFIQSGMREEICEYRSACICFV